MLNKKEALPRDKTLWIAPHRDSDYIYIIIIYFVKHKKNFVNYLTYRGDTKLSPLLTELS